MIYNASQQKRPSNYKNGKFKLPVPEEINTIKNPKVK